jgi:PST family polysaccharide transporter
VNGPTDASTTPQPDPPPPVATGGLERLVRRGALWTALNVALSRFGQFGIGIVVARLVAPEDFGIFAVALTVLMIVINVSELGVSAALVRETPEECRRLAPTVATIAIATALALTAVMVLCADAFSRAMGAENAVGAVRVLSLTVFLAGFGAVPSALLKRDFAQDKQFAADSAHTLVSAVVVVVLAMSGWGAMALAWSRVAGQLVSIVLLQRYSPERFRLGFGRAQARQLLAFGLPLTGANIVAFTLLNVDYIVIGRTLGAVQLGLYLLAFNMSSWPINVFGAVVRAVSMPAFARIGDDRARLPGLFASAASMVATITMPVCLIMGALATPLVTFVYGSAWTASAAALVGLAVFGAGRTMVELLSDFLVALGRTRGIFVIQVVWIAALVPAMIIGVDRYGIAGAGIAHAAVIIGVTLPAYIVAVRGFMITPWLLVRAIGPRVVAGFLAGTGAWLVADQVEQSWLAVVLGGPTGLVVFVSLQWRSAMELFRRLRIGKGTTAPDDGDGAEEITGTGGEAAAGHQAPVALQIPGQAPVPATAMAPAQASAPVRET